MSISNKIQREQELIYLLLHYRSAIDDFLNSSIGLDAFTKDHKSIITYIINSYEDSGVLLTRKSFLEKIKQYNIPKGRISQEVAFNKCCSSSVNINDLPVLLNQIIDENIQNGLHIALDKLNKNINSIDRISSIKILVDDCQDVLNGVSSLGEKTFYKDFRELSKERIQYIKDVKSGKIIEEPPILSGISEIDYTMVTGFEKGTLTLFCADVGGMKSSMMLNIALNVWKNGYNVLFVPLEMHRNQMWRRACAREARIDSKLITSKIKELTQEQMDKIQKMEERWDNEKAKFFIMEKPGTTSVGDIQREIERHIEIFKPKLIVIDYVANLEVEKDRRGRNDLEIGDMLKKMRQMGKTLDFAVISAAQLGRDALKRIRKAGVSQDKASINSEDIRGSHEYAADADNIFAQLKNTSQPNELLDLFCVKSRNGPTTFEDGKIKATLHIRPEFGLIMTDEGLDSMGENVDIDDILGDMVDQSETDIEVINKGALFDDSVFDDDDSMDDIIDSIDGDDNNDKDELNTW